MHYITNNIGRLTLCAVLVYVSESIFFCVKGTHVPGDDGYLLHKVVFREIGVWMGKSVDQTTINPLLLNEPF